MNKKVDISKSSWLVCALIGVFVNIHPEYNNHDRFYEYVISVLPWGFGGWVLGLIIDYILNSIFYRAPKEGVINSASKKENKLSKKKPTKKNKKKPTVSASQEFGETKGVELNDDIVLIDQDVIVDKPNVKIKNKKSDQKSNSKNNNTTNTNPFKSVKEHTPEFSIDTCKTSTEIKRVNYKLAISESVSSFPVLKIPIEKCVVRHHRVGSSKRRGYKEDSFQRSIENYFGVDFLVSGNIRLNTGENTRPYEPDIAIIGKCNLNIKIDIEIDEPYAGITRQPTHCFGDDINRDNYFKDRGWIVIRFSEYQVHIQEKECLWFIAKIISNIDPSFTVPTDLKLNDGLINEKVWDVVQSQKWEKAKYREQYLNHEFRLVEEEQEVVDRSLNNQEIEEEKLVETRFLGEETLGNNIGYNIHNLHERDRRIKFYTKDHLYTVDGIPFPSASTVIGRFFIEFDAWRVANNLSPSNDLYGLDPETIVDIWSQRGREAGELGTKLHEQIENYFLKKPYESVSEFYQFENFVKDHPNLNPYRSEWRVFDDNIGVAGTIDLIVKTSTGFDIYDWKRSKKVINIFDEQPITYDQWGKRGLGQLDHIDDTSYNKYCLQQSLYKFILEKNYNIKIENMFLVVIHPEHVRYYKVSVPYLKDEVVHILKTL